jgi:DNA repair exonuclease SbcCD ATPase subunit
MSADVPPDPEGGDSHPTGVELTVENIGGIDEAAVNFQQGVTLLTGPNATNRTSLLEAMAGALGGATPSIKSHADTGEIHLQAGNQSIDLTLHDRQSTTVSEGDAYADKQVLVDQFVRVLEDNPLRRAVETGSDLYDLLMAPVDTEDIEQQIADHRSELERIEEQIQTVEEAEGRLPTLEQRREELADRREALTAEIEEIRQSIDDYETSKQAAEEAEKLVEQVEERRSAAKAAAERVADRESELDRLRDELADIEADIAEVEAPREKLTDVESKLTELKSQRRDAQQEAADLRRIVDFNRDILEDDVDQLSTESGSPVEKLDPDSQDVECWTCGSVVERGNIHQRLETLQSVVNERRDAVSQLEERIEDLEGERDRLSRRVQRKEDLENRRERLDRQVKAQQESLAEARAAHEARQAEIETLEQRIEETEDLRDNDLLDLHQDLSEREYERGQVDRDLDDVEAEIERAETLVEERDQLVDQRDELREEIAALRSHVGDLERSAVEAINERMEDLVSELGYENIERIWVERLTTPGGETDSFDLHIVRTDEDGVAYEDTVETLSESERELVGLVLALAGYLVHDVAETVPFMLLDSLEAIDAERIATLVEYFESEVPYLVVALLPEDAERLPDHYRTVPSNEF